MKIAKYWHIVSKVDTRARLLADRHYSRQNPGYREFCPPGNNIVLIIPNGSAAAAVWASHRPDPKADLEKRRADGFDYYDNPIFRNESGICSSELIREALAITMLYWRDYLPADGFHSFVDPRHVKPIKRRGEDFYGYCFHAAGFRAAAERTAARNLIRYVLSLTDMMAIEPITPLTEQLRLFA